MLSHSFRKMKTFWWILFILPIIPIFAKEVQWESQPKNATGKSLYKPHYKVVCTLKFTYLLGTYFLTLDTRRVFLLHESIVDRQLLSQKVPSNDLSKWVFSRQNVKC